MYRLIKRKYGVCYYREYPIKKKQIDALREGTKLLIKDSVRLRKIMEENKKGGLETRAGV